MSERKRDCHGFRIHWHDRIAGNLYDSSWNPIEVSCWYFYRNLAELWLDENYYGSDNIGYKLLPFLGSTEGLDAPCIEFTRGDNITAKANGKEIVTEILNTEVVVVSEKDENLSKLVETLFDEFIES